MSEYSQSARRLVVSTPLGENALILEGFSGVEALSEPFSFTLQLASEREWIDPKDIVGQPVAFGIRLAWPRASEARIRWFHGVVRRFVQRGGTDRLSRYTAEVVPRQWFLNCRTDARVYQSKSTKDIVAEVIERAGAGDLDATGASHSYPAREYCVQYRESEHAFISRLLEEDGIFYRYARKEDGHTMVLGDSIECYADCTTEPLRRLAPFHQHRSDDDILSWEHCFDFQPGRWVMRDYNFETPGDPLETERNFSSAQAGAAPFEVFHYPGGYRQKDEGKRLTRTRMEAEDCQYDTVIADTVCPDLFPGGRFVVGRHPVAGEQEREWLVVKVEHVVHSEGELESGSGAPVSYVNRVTCIPADVLFRPVRRTPRPLVHGIQTAVVVGPPGEEIYVDKHGRVKVQFHWDRHSTDHDSASCWVRVAQPWAGAGYGSLAIPRIGQEVVIEFEEGNLDRPLINGRVYNAVQPVPVSNLGGAMSAKDITEAAMNTTLRSNSLGQTGGHNEITMNDRKGHEILFIKAQKDSINQIGHNATTAIGKNSTLDIGAASSATVGADSTLHVAGVSKVALDKDSTLTVGGSETHKVAGDHGFHVGGDSQVHVLGQYMVGAKAVGICAEQGASLVSDNSYLELWAKTSIVIQCGASEVKLDQDGTITISGTKIMANGTMEVNLACGANYVKLDPSGVTLFGTLVKIN